MLPPLPSSFHPREEFPILNHWRFFQHAGVSPLPRRSADAIRRYTDISQRDAYLTGKWYKRVEAIRQAAARLIHADPTEIAFIKNTSEGLAFVANGLSWNAGDEIISSSVEYPANVYPWMDLQKRLGVKHIMLPETAGRITPEAIFNAVTPKTRMVALSHVEYASGYRTDLPAIGRFCRERNILLCVDAIQSCGVLPVDVRAMNIDFLAACGHKWMLGPEGCGLFFCRRELITSLRPEVGWMNVINATDFEHFDFTLRSDARRFECGTHNIPGIVGFGESLDMLLEIGMETIWGRVYALTQILIEGLIHKGYRIYSPRAVEAECSGIVSFVSPSHDHNAIVKSLEEQKIIIVTRESRLRAAPHFYQDQADIQALVDALPGH